MSSMTTAPATSDIVKREPNPPITRVFDDLFLGDAKASYTASILKEHHITAVMSLGNARWGFWNMSWYKDIIREGNHLFLLCEDSMTMDMLPLLAQICDFIRECREAGPVLVHCDRGISRSVTAMIAYLVRDREYNVDAALALIKGKRRVRPNKNFMEQLRVWEELKGDIWLSPGVPQPAYASFLDVRAGRLEAAGLTGNEPIGIQSL